MICRQPLLGGPTAWVHVTPESAEVQIFPATAASLVPSLEDVIPYQYCPLPTEVSLVQVNPESVDVQMFPPQHTSTAASLVPSLEIVMPVHSFEIPTDESSVHVAPESWETQIFPFLTTAASLVPSAEEATLYQSFVFPMELTLFQAACAGASAHRAKNRANKLRDLMIKWDPEVHLR